MCVCVDCHHGWPGDLWEGYFSLSPGWQGLTGQGEGQASRGIPVTGLERRGEMSASSRDCLAVPPPPFPQPPPAFVSFPKLDWGSQTGQQKQLSSKPLPPVGLSHIGGEGGREPLPFSQCLRCAPSAPPGPGILFAARCDRAQEPEGVGGQQQLEGELSGKGLVLAAGREFDGLLCRPRGFSLIPLCVPACSPSLSLTSC